LDEFADMRPEAWYEVIRPSLSDRQGSALFIGTPKGRNHFYDLWTQGADGNADWEAFQYTTIDGGQVAPEEIEAAKRDLDERTFNQEYNAQFVNYSGIIYYNFSREESVKRSADDGSMLHIGMDFNLDPMSAVVAIRDGSTLKIIDEIVIYGSNTDEIVDEIKTRFPSRQICVYPDPAARQRKTVQEDEQTYPSSRTQDSQLRSEKAFSHQRQNQLSQRQTQVSRRTKTLSHRSTLQASHQVTRATDVQRRHKSAR
jgi:hypothetical protein